jgi:hypothetical protein
MSRPLIIDPPSESAWVNWPGSRRLPRSPIPDPAVDRALAAVAQDESRPEAEREAAIGRLVARHRGLLIHLRKAELRVTSPGVAQELDVVAEDAARAAVLSFDAGKGTTVGWWLGRKALWAMKDAAASAVKAGRRADRARRTWGRHLALDPGDLSPEEHLAEALATVGHVIDSLPDSRMQLLARVRLLPAALGRKVPKQSEIAGQLGVSQQLVSKLEARAKALLAARAGEVPREAPPPAPVRVFNVEANRRLPPALVIEMSEEKRAELRFAYETLPVRKRAAGLCPESGCRWPSWSPTTGRCRGCAVRWPRFDRDNLLRVEAARRRAT